MRWLILALAVLASLSPATGQSCTPALYCTEMRDCAEADFHFRQCGEAERDGDSDGIPCENLCGDTMELYLARRAQTSGAIQLVQPSFSCAGKRTCGQMSSCEEAQFYLLQCSVSGLDRDGDGRACNALCGAR